MLLAVRAGQGVWGVESAVYIGGNAARPHLSLPQRPERQLLGRPRGCPSPSPSTPCGVFGWQCVDPQRDAPDGALRGGGVF